MQKPVILRAVTVAIVALCSMSTLCRNAAAIDPDGRAAFFRNAEYMQFSDDPFVDDQGPLDEPMTNADLDKPSPGASCSAGDCWSGASCGTYVLPLDGFFINGWIAQGYTGNADQPENRFNLPVTFNDRADEYQLNQVYLAVGKEVDVACRSWDIGGRVDVLYGSDYFFTDALGLETNQDASNKWNGEGPRFDRLGNSHALYGVAMPQAYAELLVPFADATTIKLGHFYTIMGYESVEAPQNFFYSRSYVMQYGEPKTHTGILAASEVGCSWTFHYGLTRGWDTFEDPNSTLGFLGGISYISPDERTSLSFTLHTGNEDAAGDNNRTAYSLVLVRELGYRLTYVFQHDFGIEANRELNGALELDDAKWYGINQYLFCRLTDKLDLGWRVEWFRDQDNARVLGVPIQPFVSGGNYAATTLGLNWRPHENVVIRPEIRYDASDVKPPFRNGMFRDFTKDEQLTIALDLIISL
jgi:hypothetical protein